MKFKIFEQVFDPRNLSKSWRVFMNFSGDRKECPCCMKVRYCGADAPRNGARAWTLALLCSFPVFKSKASKRRLQHSGIYESGHIGSDIILLFQTMVGKNYTRARLDIRHRVSGYWIWKVQTRLNLCNLWKQKGWWTHWQSIHCVRMRAVGVVTALWSARVQWRAQITKHSNDNYILGERAAPCVLDLNCCLREINVTCQYLRQLSTWLSFHWESRWESSDALNVWSYLN